MGFSLSALRRSKGVRQPSAPQAAAQAGVYVSAADLAALEHAARDFTFLPRQPVHSLLAGRHGSRLRGRGLAFEELRHYVPGDDIRTIDWRVTARTGKPFVRVYSEEKDRPALLIVDQRINMFFGTRRAMKSVAAAEVAALAAWGVLGQGDRVGGFVFNDDRIDELQPYRSRAAAMHLLETVAAQNVLLRGDGPAQRNRAQLDAALDAAARVARHDHLIVIASDFDGAGDRTRDLLMRLAAHNDVVAVLVYDPFLLHLPETGELVVSNGELQVELRVGGAKTRKGIAELADARAKAILGWQTEIGIPVFPLSADKDTAVQLRKLLGRPTGPRVERNAGVGRA
jgi:uncharacterized protein (DUF58 family)